MLSKRCRYPGASAHKDTEKVSDGDVKNLQLNPWVSSPPSLVSNLSFSQVSSPSRVFEALIVFGRWPHMLSAHRVYTASVCVCSTVASGVGHSLAFIILFHTLSGSPSLPLLLLLALILSFYFDLIILFNYFCFHLSLFLTIKSFPSTLSSFIQHYLKVASKDSPSLVATSLNKIIRISILICWTTGTSHLQTTLCIICI